VTSPPPVEEPASPGAAEPGAEGYEPVSATILRGVRDLILDGRLAPGERIRQEALAERYGVSRIPVREALRQLENEGLVTLVPHSGARVARLDFDECMEIYRLREALEPLLMEEVARRATDAHIEAFEARMLGVEASVDDPSLWLAEDRLFHLEMYRLAEMPRVLAFAESAWNQTQQYRRAYMMSLEVGPFEVAHLQHRLILDAVRRHDEYDAAEMERIHIRRTRIALGERAELFDPARTP
jgi:DNA-binding GntR family transcriptional regulator